ncbi:MAG: helix-turn-helix transcriptional regulator [Clostridia bacterium]|nr:helix-turn-helix transcriptional regulator [Clostridia bacterium]
MIGEHLKTIRKKSRNIYNDLAKKMNISLSTVKSWEGGHSEPSHSMLVTICRMYHVSSDFLLGLSDVDPLFLDQAQSQLTDEDHKFVQYFEEFLIYKGSKESKRQKEKT